MIFGSRSCQLDRALEIVRLLARVHAARRAFLENCWPRFFTLRPLSRVILPDPRVRWKRVVAYFAKLLALLAGKSSFEDMLRHATRDSRPARRGRIIGDGAGGMEDRASGQIVLVPLTFCPAHSI